MDRRQFLQTGAAALAAGSLPDIPTSRPPSIKKAVKFGMVRIQGTVLEKFQLLRELGYDGVELSSPNNLDAAEVLKARDTTRLPIHGVVDSQHWQHTLGDPAPGVRRKGVEALETALRDCKRYGGSTVLLVPGRVTRQISYDQVYERSQAEIRKVLPLAQELKVKIAIENVWNGFLLSPLEAARYIDEFQSPWIGWYFDVGNIVNYGFPDQWIRILGKRILKLDIKGYSRKKRDNEGLWKGFQVPIGDDDCDWPAVRKALAEVGYEGWATAEVGGGDKQRLADIAALMDQVLKGA